MTTVTLRPIGTWSGGLFPGPRTFPGATTFPSRGGMTVTPASSGSLTLTPSS